MRYIAKKNYNNEYIHDYINNEEKITFKASELYDKYCSWYLKCGFNNKPNTIIKEIGLKNEKKLSNLFSYL
jgi:hypothetical protein